jgi:uncharacterized protein YbjQ (UPF0145 family)
VATYRGGVPVGGSASGLGPQLERIAAGGLATSTERRLAELTRWGGFSSFGSPAAFVVGESVSIRPVGQVLGIATGIVQPGYLRRADQWNRPVQPRIKQRSNAVLPGVLGARWQAHPGIVEGWNWIRRRALARLADQATRLGSQAVVGLEARRHVHEPAVGHELEIVIEFTGTAVRVEGWAQRRTGPVMIPASVAEVAVMFQQGIEPLGIVCGVGRIELRPAGRTVSASQRSGARAPNAELEDVTHSIDEARRAATAALQIEAAGLSATGVLGTRVEFDQAGQITAALPGVGFTAHAVGLAIRRLRPPGPLGVSPTVDAGARAGG